MTLLRAEVSALLVIDVQARLLPHIHAGAATLEHCHWLVRVARRLDVPVLASEQYPEGLGPTVAPLVDDLPPENIRRKTHFSCVADGCFHDHPGFSRPQVVVCGTEAHVCVLQTALDLRQRGREVFVVAEAVSSRRPESKALALDRMRQHGVEIVDREMVAFEWLHRAGDDRFRAVSREFIR
ncbi:MAG: hydrolase [Burkholderiales bacterium]